MLAKYQVPDQLFVTPGDLFRRYGKFDHRILRGWIKAGRVRKLRKGLYPGQPDYVRCSVDMFTVANRLQTPSYVSFTMGLRYHNLIPEGVFEITSATTRKASVFRYRYQRYSYQTLPPKLFFGYEVVPFRGNTYVVAEIEKVLLDVAYVTPFFEDPGWLYEVRFDDDEMRENINWVRMYCYARAMGSERIMRGVEALIREYDL